MVDNLCICLYLIRLVSTSVSPGYSENFTQVGHLNDSRDFLLADSFECPRFRVKTGIRAGYPGSDLLASVLGRRRYAVVDD